MFTPVEINGRVLADGGMVQNIPVETVLDMDADAVIAVELRLPPGDVKELETLTGVLSRAVEVMITQNEHRSLALAKATVTIAMNGFRRRRTISRVRELVELGSPERSRQSAALLPYAIQDPSGVAAIFCGRVPRADTGRPTRSIASRSPALIPTQMPGSNTGSARRLQARSISPNSILS